MTKEGTSGDGEPVVVVGLGRFGGALARSLVRMGHDVLAIDHDAALVQRWASELTHVVEADSTDPEALKQLICGLAKALYAMEHPEEKTDA